MQNQSSESEYNTIFLRPENFNCRTICRNKAKYNSLNPRDELRDNHKDIGQFLYSPSTGKLFNSQCMQKAG